MEMCLQQQYLRSHYFNTKNKTERSGTRKTSRFPETGHPNRTQIRRASQQDTLETKHNMARTCAAREAPGETHAALFRTRGAHARKHILDVRVLSPKRERERECMLSGSSKRLGVV